MKDAAFTSLLSRTAKAQNRYLDLLEEAEAEYERRYGRNPSDAEDDQWIDAMHCAGGRALTITAADVAEGAEHNTQQRKSRCASTSPGHSTT